MRKSSLSQRIRHIQFVLKRILKKGDKVLFIDDFLANGEAFKGTENLIAQAQAEIVGVGMVIEKAFQKGHAYITEKDMTF